MGLILVGRSENKLKRSFYTLLIALFASCLALAEAKDESEANQAWNATGIDANFIATLVEPKVCAVDLKHFKGCVESVRVIAAANRKELKVSGSGVTVASPTSQETKSSQSDARTASELRAEWDKFQGTRQRENALIAQIFNSPLLKDIALNSLVRYSQDLYLSLPKPERAARVGGEAYNAYLAQVYDPHTYIMPTKLFQNFSTQDGVKYAGIGADLISTEDDGFLLVPIDGSPSQKAGLQPGDRLVTVSQQPIHGLGAAEVIKLLRGADGSQVLIEVMRKGAAEPVRLVVTRGIVQLHNVQSKIIEQRGFRAGYIQLRGFTHQNTVADLTTAIYQLQSEHVQGLVLDLRGNGGGRVDFAVQIAALFLPQRSLVVEVRSIPELAPMARMGTTTAPVTQLPLVVLVDGQSASASELLAGALQDHQRAWLVGERTFGKGTVQNVFEFASLPDTVQAKTVAVFYQPNGQTNQLVGLQPDIEVPIKMGATADERFVLREADTYANAIQVNREAYRHPRPKELSQLKDQLGLHGYAEKDFSQEQYDYHHDYQLLKALDVLRVEP